MSRIKELVMWQMDWDDNNFASAPYMDGDAMDISFFVELAEVYDGLDVLSTPPRMVP